MLSKHWKQVTVLMRRRSLLAHSSQKHPAWRPRQKLLSQKLSTYCMMPIPIGEKFVHYPCLDDMNGEPYRFARQRNGWAGRFFHLSSRVPWLRGKRTFRSSESALRE